MQRFMVKDNLLFDRVTFKVIKQPLLIVSNEETVKITDGEGNKELYEQAVSLIKESEDALFVIDVNKFALTSVEVSILLNYFGSGNVPLSRFQWIRNNPNINEIKMYLDVWKVMFPVMDIDVIK